MAQVPVDEKTYSRLSVMKAKAVIEKGGNSVTWDDVISAACDVCDAYSEKFIEKVKLKKGKTRTMPGDDNG